MKYQYLSKNPWSNVIDYSFSSYRGKNFLNAYKKNRLDFLDKYKKFSNESYKLNLIISHDERFLQILKKFEISKKVFNSYDQNGFATSDEFKEISNYIDFSEKCCQYYNESQNLIYLNSLLKSNDIIISMQTNIHDSLIPKFLEIVKFEVQQTKDIFNF